VNIFEKTHWHELHIVKINSGKAHSFALS